MTQAELGHKAIRDLRQYLLPAMIQEFGDRCAVCGKHKSSYEIDHLRYGNQVTIHDLQLLCVDCHRDKTMTNNEAHLSRTPHCPTCTCYDCPHLVLHNSSISKLEHTAAQ